MTGEHSEELADITYADVDYPPRPRDYLPVKVDIVAPITAKQLRRAAQQAYSLNLFLEECEQKVLSLMGFDLDWLSNTLIDAAEKMEAADPPLCRNGLHPMVPDNTYVQPSTGHRRCRACARQTKRWARAVGSA